MSAATIETQALENLPLERAPLEGVSRELSSTEGSSAEWSSSLTQDRVQLRVVPEGPVTPRRRRRASRGRGRRTHPAVRPAGAVPPPVLGRRTGIRSQACSAEAVPAPELQPAVRPVARGWRLTDRGIGVVLVAGAMVLAAAVTVIAATALTVTSESYQPLQVISAGR